jgi:uncharacterized protein
MELGLLKSGINEVIATTAFNAAPMGIHYRDGNASMVIFSGSNTAENIERDGWVVANFVHDPVVYVRTAFEDLPQNSFIEETVAKKIMMRLSGADAWAAFAATIVRKTDVSMMVRLTLEKEIIEEVALHPVNRGFNSIIDATVHATRYKENRDPELKKLIDYHLGIVRKCGGKRESEALDLLMKHL